MAIRSAGCWAGAAAYVMEQTLSYHSLKYPPFPSASPTTASSLSWPRIMNPSSYQSLELPNHQSVL